MGLRSAGGFMIAEVLMPRWRRIRRIDYNAFRAEMSCGASNCGGMEGDVNVGTVNTLLWSSAWVRSLRNAIKALCNP